MFNSRSRQEPYWVVKEQLKNTQTDLTCFYFLHGGNFYVFSYEKGGVRRHTFIDTGASNYRSQVLSILLVNNIDPTKIERIIITHRHTDHCGLADVLAQESGARVLAHASFRSFIEGELTEEERRWLGGFDPSRLKACDIEYLSETDVGVTRSINGVDFIRLSEPEIGEGCQLEILTCPNNASTHTSDQLVVLYSPRNCAQPCGKTHEDFRPTDSLLFSGDLWLMRGPLTGWGKRRIFRYWRYWIRWLLFGKTIRRNVREQDAKAKDALKKGFSLIRVKPGHGEEFMGSRIIPQGLLADRDLLVALGHSLDTPRSVLEQIHFAPQIMAIKEQAYTNFVKELLLWRELGYTPGEISALLVRIYKEQSWGDRLAQRDRKERRQRLKATLARLKDDEAQPGELCQLAQRTLSELKAIS